MQQKLIFFFPVILLFTFSILLNQHIVRWAEEFKNISVKIDSTHTQTYSCIGLDILVYAGWILSNSSG